MLRNLGLEEDWKVWDLIGLISFKIGFGLGLTEVWNGMWIRIRRDYDGARYGFKIFQKLTRVKRYFQKKKSLVSCYSAWISRVKLFATFLILGVIFDTVSAQKKSWIRV